MSGNVLKASHRKIRVSPAFKEPVAHLPQVRKPPLRLAFASEITGEGA